MKYGFNSFVLEANTPVAIRGSDSLYTFQNISNNPITVLGSNNGTDWVSLCTVSATNAKTVQSAFKFLCINSGTLLVNRAAAGSNTTTALVDADGNAISQTFPMPISSTSGTSTSVETLQGRAWVAEFACAAQAATYSKIALYNPIGSGKVISFFSIYGAVSIGTVAFTTKKITSVSGMTEIPQSASNRQNLANNTSHAMKAYYSNEGTLLSDFNISRVNVASVYPIFTNSSIALPLLVLNEGEGVLFEANTTSTTIYLRPLFCEVTPIQV